MTRFSETMPASYFDTLYAADADPWQFADSPYERGKYVATLAALPWARYRAGLEVGCSIGILTEQLAARCDALLAIDTAAAPLAAARQRCSALANVRFERRHVPAGFPLGRYDLVLLSEVAYYLGPSDVHTLARRVVDSLERAGHVVLVHWLGPTNYPLSGDRAVDLFVQAAGASVEAVSHHRTDAYRLDVLRRVAACANV